MANKNNQLETVLKHYMIAALWSSTDMDTDEPLDSNYDIDDISDKTKAEMKRDVTKFLKENKSALYKSGLDDEQIGHDFWLSRNGHGAGFFDRGLDKDIEDKLEDSSTKFKNIDLYVGDDKKIHSMTAYEKGGKLDATYYVSYYAKVGQHGELGYKSSNFDAVYREAMDFYKRTKKEKGLGSDITYIGVEGSGNDADKFAVIYIDESYLKYTDEKDFGNPSNFKAWEKVAKSCLESGKAKKGSYGNNEIKQKYIVFYSSKESGGMREKSFDSKKEADDFAKEVDGSVTPIKLANGGKLKDFLGKAKHYTKKGVEGAKKGYGKAKEFTDKKIRDQKRKIAFEVINEARYKTENKKESQILGEADNLVAEYYAKGGGVGKLNKFRDNYNNLIGKKGDEYYFLTSIFAHDDNFMGATGHVIMPVGKAQYEYATSRDGLAERFLDAMGEDEWISVLNLDRDDFDSEDALQEAIIDGIEEQHSNGQLDPFEVAHREEDEMRKLPEFSDSDEYPIFEIIGVGRIFSNENKFDKVYDKKLLSLIEKFENNKMAKGGSTGGSEKNKMIYNYILDAIDSEGYDVKTENDADKIKFVWKNFLSEYGHEIKRRGVQKAFEEWIMGLPSSFNIDYENHKIIEIGKKWGLLKPDATDGQEDKFIKSWWARIFMGLRAAARKNKVDLSYKYEGDKPVATFAKGGGVYSSDEMYQLSVFDAKTNELLTSKRFWAKNQREANEIGEEHESSMKTKYGDYLRFKVEKAPSMAKGGSTSDDAPRIYVADLAAYNDGKLIGEWLDLSDYSSGSEVMEAIDDLLKKWSKEQGEEREEYAIHDHEGIPSSLYSESMGESEFDEIISTFEVAEDNGVPIEVVLQWVADGNDADSFSNAFRGKYDTFQDYAEQLVDDIGLESFSNPSYYLEITETDRRIMAGEEADIRVGDLSDEEMVSQAGMESEFEEAKEKQNEIEEKQTEIEEKESEIDSLDSEDDADELSDAESELKVLEEELSELEGELKDMDSADDVVKQAREKLHDEIYNEWYDGLSDPVDFLVNQQGLYSEKDLMKSGFLRIDYEALANDLESDYTTIDHDGDVYVFDSNYEKGGKLKGNKLLVTKKDGEDYPTYTIDFGNVNVGNNHTFEHLISALLERDDTDDIFSKIGDMEADGDLEIKYKDNYGNNYTDGIAVSDFPRKKFEDKFERGGSLDNSIFGKEFVDIFGM